MSDDINYYELLEVTSTASQMEIRRAYKKIALKFHPDKNPTGAESFKNVTNAYNVLSDPILKNKYDMDNSSLFIREFFKFHKYDNDHEWNFFDKENKYSTRSNNEIPLNIKKFSSRNEKFYGEKIVELFLLFTMLYTTNKEMEMKLIYKVITFFKQNLFYTPYSFCVTNDEEVVAELFFAFTKLCDWEEKRIQELTSKIIEFLIVFPSYDMKLMNLYDIDEYYNSKSSNNSHECDNGLRKKMYISSSYSTSRLNKFKMNLDSNDKKLNRILEILEELCKLKKDETNELIYNVIDYSKKVF